VREAGGAGQGQVCSEAQSHPAPSAVLDGNDVGRIKRAKRTTVFSLADGKKDHKHAGARLVVGGSVDGSRDRRAYVRGPPLARLRIP